MYLLSPFSVLTNHEGVQQNKPNLTNMNLESRVMPRNLETRYRRAHVQRQRATTDIKDLYVIVLCINFFWGFR